MHVAARVHGGKIIARVGKRRGTARTGRGRVGAGGAGGGVHYPLRVMDGAAGPDGGVRERCWAVGRGSVMARRPVVARRGSPRAMTRRSGAMAVGLVLLIAGCGLLVPV